MDIDYKTLYEEKGYECNHLKINNRKLEEDLTFWKSIAGVMFFVFATITLFGYGNSTPEDQPECEPTGYYSC